MKYCGIDLHSNNSVVMITDETDRVVYSKRLPNDLPQILAALEIHRAELSGVVVESTFNWYWLVDGLQESGYCVHLANTTAIKQYDGLKHRGDESDARQLAHLLRLGLLPQGHIMPKAARAVRDLARKRMQLVQQRTSQILSIESSLSRHTGGRIKSDVIKRLRESDLNELKLGEMQTLGLKAHVAVMRALQAQIDSLEMVLAHPRWHELHLLRPGQSYPRMNLRRPTTNRGPPRLTRQPNFRSNGRPASTVPLITIVLPRRSPRR